MYNLLICDDESYVLDLLTNDIRWSEYGVRVKDTAINGQIGLNKFKMGNFDIVLTDIKMPIMSGVEMARNIRAMDKRVQIIFLTSYGEFEYAQSAIHLNACAYVLKPFCEDDLIASVKSAVERLNSGQIQSNTESGKDGEDFVIHNINQYIEEHIGKKLSLRMISEHFGYSPNYLGQLYKKNTGMFINDYIIKVKMEKAVKLLEVPQNQIGSIADLLGYNDLAYFIKQFKEYYGVTPKAFRDRKSRSSQFFN